MVQSIQVTVFNSPSLVLRSVSKNVEIKSCPNFVICLNLAVVSLMLALL